MRVFDKTPRKIALFLTCMIVMVAYADVKLRIYLRDGNLQAGNLVAETKETFVILTKEGRVEVPKDKIMFVNGKTLKQWEQRPDRLFQTEIIPEELPNPAFVNGKAPLPDVPKIEPITKPLAELKPEQPKAEAKPVVKAMPSPSPTPVPSPSILPVKKQEEPASEEEKVVEPKAVEPATQAATEPKRTRRRRARPASEEVKIPEKKPVVEEQAPAEQTIKPVVAPVTALSEATSLVERPKGFKRTEMAAYHYERAKEFLGRGARGQGIQELHMAVLLDRQKEKPIYELGRLYMEEGQFGRAEKYFSHPLLRKKEDVKKFVQDMQDQRTADKKYRQMLFGATGATLFLLLPLMSFLKRVDRQKKAKAPRVITAETAEELMNETSVVEPSELESPLSKRVLESHRPIPELKAEPTPYNKDEVAPSTSMSPVAPPPPPPPMAKPVFQPPVSPVAPPAAPPVVPSVVPTPEPVLVPEFRLDPAPVPSVEEVLAAASLMDEAMQRGNVYAAEGQWDKARREYRTALALNPANIDAHLGLGYLSFAQEQWDLAMEHYIRALQINPNSPDAHYSIGRVLLEMDRIEEAVPRFQAALRLDPTFDDARDCLTSLGKAV